MDEATTDPTFLSISEAALALGITRQRVWQLCRRGELSTTQNPLDRREKLIPKADVDRLDQFRRRKRNL